MFDWRRAGVGGGLRSTTVSLTITVFFMFPRSCSLCCESPVGVHTGGV